MQAPFMMNKEIMAQTAQLEEFDEALYTVSWYYLLWDAAYGCCRFQVETLQRINT
jgi:seryl-tRNA synthetase